MANNMTNWDVEAQNIEQRRRYADALRSQSMEPINPGQLPGVPISPFQGLAKVFKSYTGAKLDRKAAEDSQNLTTRRNQALTDALKGAFEPVPGQVAQMGEMGEQVAPAVPERQRTTQEISRALLGNPDTMQLGGNMLVKDMTSRMSDPANMPSSIQEWREYNAMNPKDQARYLEMKRNPNIMNLGGSMAVRGPGGGITDAYTVTPRPGEMPEFQGDQERAKAGAKAEVDRGSDFAKKSVQAGNMSDYIKEAEGLLTDATGGYAGTALSLGKKVLNISDKKTQADQQLKLISGWMISNVPRMEGPQSDFDVKNYREMAGMVGDSTVPIDDRKAALTQLRKLQEKYLKPASPAGNSGRIRYDASGNRIP